MRTASRVPTSSGIVALAPLAYSGSLRFCIKLPNCLTLADSKQKQLASSRSLNGGNTPDAKTRL